MPRSWCAWNCWPILACWCGPSCATTGDSRWIAGPNYFRHAPYVDLQCFGVHSTDERHPDPTTWIGPVAEEIGSDAHALTRCVLKLACDRSEHDWVVAKAEVSFPCMTRRDAWARKVYAAGAPALASHELEHARFCVEEADELNRLSETCEEAREGMPRAIARADARSEAFDLVTDHGRRTNDR